MASGSPGDWPAVRLTDLLSLAEKWSCGSAVGGELWEVVSKREMRSGIDR